MRRKKMLPAVGLALGLTAALMALAATTHPKPIMTCHRTATPGRVVEGDISGSVRSTEKMHLFLDVVHHSLVEAGVCGGPVVVEVWSRAGTTRVLWGPDDPFTVTGSTTTARSNSANRAADRAMPTITARYRTALHQAPPAGSDVTAWATIVTDTLHELHDRAARPVEVVVVTDGVMVTGTVNLNRPLTVTEAASLAAGVSMPRTLRGVRVTMIGVGSPTGPPPPTGGEWVDAIRRFAGQTCRATGASCDVLGATVSGTVE
jgi:hypothetical protein